jgi:hypothetical protein
MSEGRVKKIQSPPSSRRCKSLIQKRRDELWQIEVFSPKRFFDNPEAIGVRSLAQASD